MADVRDCPVLRFEPATEVPELIERLTAIRDATGEVAPRCGITNFSDLYLTITQCIWDHIQKGGFFTDNQYLDRLDVGFANRYLDALRAWAGGGRTPRAWRGRFPGAPKGGGARPPPGRGAGGAPPKIFTARARARPPRRADSTPPPRPAAGRRP